MSEEVTWIKNQLEVPKSVSTHDGVFHADDVFSIAVLSILNPELIIIRTRDPDILKTTDIRVDVGGNYNPTTGDYDHHQPDAPRYPDHYWNKETLQGPKMSGIGLIWKHFGVLLVDQILYRIDQRLRDDAHIGTVYKVHENIQRNLIVPIDIEDNGEQHIYFPKVEVRPSPYFPITVSNIINSYVPSVTTIDLDIYTQQFLSAVAFAKNLLTQMIIKNYNALIQIDPVYEWLSAWYNDPDHPPFIIFEEPCEWQFAFTHSRKMRYRKIFDILFDIQYVIHPSYSADGGYNWLVSPMRHWDFNAKTTYYKSEFPSGWKGKSREELVALSGIQGLTFIHPAGFLAGCTNKEDAIRLVKTSMEKSV